MQRKRGPAWYAKYRLPDGRQRQRKIGPAWTSRGRPPAGYHTKRTAEDVAAGGARPGAPGDAAGDGADRRHVRRRGRRVPALRRARPRAEALDAAWATARSIRSYLLPAFGERRLEDITTHEIERWRTQLEGRRKPLSNATRNRILVLLHTVLARACRVWGLPLNPASSVERHAVRMSGDIEVFSPEEVWALVRAAGGEQDGAIFLTAAFTGLRRGELLALRWRDLDFAGCALRVRASYAGGALTSPKSGKVRSVPLAPEVAEALARLAGREWFTGEDDLVFPGETGDYLDGSALRRRYNLALRRAGLRPLRFHDLRHTFGTRVIAKVDIRRVQEWMGHADVQTTMRYLHFVPRAEDARLVAEAFRVDHPKYTVGTYPPTAEVGP